MHKWEPKDWLLLAIWSLIPMMFAMIAIHYIVFGTEVGLDRLDIVGDLMHTVIGVLAGILGGAAYVGRKNRNGKEGE